jgi:hypothetical protein
MATLFYFAFFELHHQCHRRISLLTISEVQIFSFGVVFSYIHPERETMFHNHTKPQEKCEK